MTLAIINILTSLIVPLLLGLGFLMLINKEHAHHKDVSKALGAMEQTNALLMEILSEMKKHSPDSSS